MNSNKFSRYGILFVVSAPSGAGKTTLCDALRQTPDFVYSVSCTTRPPRAGEIEGEDYIFLPVEEFLARVKVGEFLEYAKVHEHYYGTLREPLIENLKNGVMCLSISILRGQLRFEIAVMILSGAAWPMFSSCHLILTNCD